MKQTNKLKHQPIKVCNSHLVHLKRLLEPITSCVTCSIDTIAYSIYACRDNYELYKQDNLITKNLHVAVMGQEFDRC